MGRNRPLQANPLRIEQNYQEIRDNRKDGLEKPKERAEYLCKHMNHFLPSNSGEEYVNLEDLRKCRIPEFDWTGRLVWLGLDLAMTVDNCAFSMVTEEDLKIHADILRFCAFGPNRREEPSRKNQLLRFYQSRKMFRLR